MLLRPYRPDDREACLALFDSNVPTFFASFEKDGFVTFIDELAEEGIEYVAVQDGERIVACGGVALRAGEARMCWGIVHGKRHGEGIGSTLLVLRLLRGAMLGATFAGLDTIPRTVPFFERLGFRVVGKTDDYYGPGIHRRDMKLVFDDTTVTKLRARLAELTAGRVDIAPSVFRP
ncbi:MAG TPA: GNAT family N-acetyltransferase [Labilithrix sp.]|jgi:ribosomal protein S18 acetylase RimI-like enzyme|nr:GNAT family N-acetyltransferase [Labilithrix sp.]